MEAVRERALSWAKSRRGVAVLVLAAFLSLASVHSLSAVLMLPITFLVFCGVNVIVLAVAAWYWERRVVPGTPPFARPRNHSSQGRRLKEDANARLWSDRKGFLFEKRFFFHATGLPPVRLKPTLVESIAARRHSEPVAVVRGSGRTWWAVGGSYFWESGGYGAQDVLALVRDRERRQQRELDRAHMLLKAEASGLQRREPINREMKQAVYARDGGACVECGSTFDLQYDHIIPVALGGATSIENLQLLCSACNLEKGATI